MPNTRKIKEAKNIFATFGTLQGMAAPYLVRAVGETAFRQGDKAMTNMFASKLQHSLLTGALAMGALMSPSLVLAQGTTVLVNVPFAFENGSQHFPAGTYRIDLTSPHLMSLHGTTTNAAGFTIMFPEPRSKPLDRGKVVFHRYGDHLYIREVWVAGDTRSYECVTSSAEKRDKQLLIAKNSTLPSNVEVAVTTRP
jgi:hypothetical protein